MTALPPRPPATSGLHRDALQTPDALLARIARAREIAQRSFNVAGVGALVACAVIRGAAVAAMRHTLAAGPVTPEVRHQMQIITRAQFAAVIVLVFALRWLAVGFRSRAAQEAGSLCPSCGKPLFAGMTKLRNVIETKDRQGRTVYLNCPECSAIVASTDAK